VIRPAYPKIYLVPNVPDFKRLAWEEGNADFRTREPTPILKYYDHVSFRFKLSGEKEARATLDYPANEKLKQFLDEGRVGHTAHDVYNARGARRQIHHLLRKKASLRCTASSTWARSCCDQLSGWLAEQPCRQSRSAKNRSMIAGFILGENRGPAASPAQRVGAFSLPAFRDFSRLRP
jgi:hypothetical protein